MDDDLKESLIELKLKMSANLLQDVAMSTVAVICTMNREVDQIQELRDLVNSRADELMNEEFISRMAKASGGDEIQVLMQEAEFFAQRIVLDELGNDSRQLDMLMAEHHGRA